MELLEKMKETGVKADVVSWNAGQASAGACGCAAKRFDAVAKPIGADVVPQTNDHLSGFASTAL